MICLRQMLVSRISQHVFKKSISALYIPGDVAKEQYAVLHPYMNFTEIFNNAEKMKNNIKLRQMDIDFPTIQKSYDYYDRIENEMKKKEIRKTEIVTALKELSKEQFVNHKKLEDLKNEGKIIREELKQLKSSKHKIENRFIQDFLQLPNSLNSNTPTGGHPQIVYRYRLPSSKVTTSHISQTDFIDFHDDSCYYLLNDAALFDIELPHNCIKYFLKNNFIQSCNPDFARKIILEAAGVSDEKVYHEIQEDDDVSTKINTLHLNGGGSFSSYLGFISKLSVYPTALPIKLISSGRQYYVQNDNLKENKGLFTATQTNCVQAFVATQTAKKANHEFEEILNLVIDVYKKLGVHFQIIYETPNRLSQSESLKASFQMYSTYYGEYIEVGNINNYTDFISKRLLFNYREGKDYKFPHIIGGTIIDVSKVIGCLLENNKPLISPKYVEQKSSAVENFKDLFE